jgi:CHASE1-domain containing sensor protein
MTPIARRHAALALIWLLLTAAGCVGIARAALDTRQAAFETDARIAHRLLSQRVVEHDAILATLALLQPGTRLATRRPSSACPPSTRRCSR